MQEKKACGTLEIMISHLRPLAYALSLLLLCGCTTSYNVATEKSESLMISTEREVQMGEAISKQVDKQFNVIKDPEMLARLDRVSQRIAAVSDRKELTYRFSIVETKEETEGKDEPNAFALPGGIIYITASLMKLLPSDDELAAVLGHEMGHVVAKHALKRLQGALGLQLLQLIAAGTQAGDARTQAGMDLAFTSILLEYSQADELEADRLSVHYLKRAGFRSDATIDALTRIRDYAFKQPLHQHSYFRTHPYFADRLRVVRQEAHGQITFDDYINIKK